MTPGIAVVGAGIAGLALAAALDRRGFSSVIFEQAAHLAEIGAGIQIAPNASRLLHRLGLARRLGEVAVRPRATEFRRWSDDGLIGRTVLGDECERVYGAPYYTIHRADLRNALASLIRADSLRLGRQLVTVREESDRAVLGFADGSSHEAWVAAGADGIRSVVRAALAADQPAFAGFGVYRGIVPAAAVPELVREPAIRVWPGPGRHLVCYPVCAGAAVSFAATVPSAVAGRESWDAPGTAQDLSRSFSGWNQCVRRLIGGAQQVRRLAVYDRAPIGRLSTSLLALVGDAAHPMLPFAAQGANQAIEDAMVLAACVSRGPAGTMTLAASRYSQSRAERTARVQRQARRDIGGLHLPDGELQRSRDKALSAGLDLRRQAWLYEHDAEGGCPL